MALFGDNMQKYLNFQFENKKMSYLEQGHPGGVPVFFFHGFPGSADQALIFNNCIESHNLHILSPDRPGYGDSTAENNFDFDAILASCMALAENAGWNKFHVVGVSGGAPYARMMALTYPDRIASCTTVCGLGLLDSENIKHMKSYESAGLRLLRILPSSVSKKLIKEFIKRISAEHAFKKMIAEASEADRSVLNDPKIKVIMEQSFLSAIKQCHLGIHFDLLIYARKLERTLGDIRCPLVLFHATEDRVVPIQMSEFFARKLPHAEFIPVKGEGHFSLPIRRSELIANKILQLHKGGT